MKTVFYDLQVKNFSMLLTTVNPSVEEVQIFCDSKKTQNIAVTIGVSGILSGVKTKKDQAVIEYSNKFDSANLQNSTDIILDPHEIENGYNRINESSPKLIEALSVARNRIFDFHANTIPENSITTDEFGNTIGYKWSTIQDVGVYVPGGSAAYPSSVLMNVIPALAAGVHHDNIYITTPAKNGIISDAILSAAYLCGISNIYKIGGATAIAALAYGTETVKKVDKIVGPGGAYVAEAKRQVFGNVGIDMIAGPTDVCIIADETANPKFIALDMIAQAEHGEDSSSVLITDSSDMARLVISELEHATENHSRKNIIIKSLRNHGMIYVIHNLLEYGTEIANMIAPEHLQICTQNAHDFVERIHHAGAIFIGEATCEALGDYILGPSHTLPTYSSAKFSQGLSVYDFLKKISIMEIFNPKTSISLYQNASLIAESEMLEGHKNSLDARITEYDI